MRLVVAGQTDVGQSRGHNEDFLLKDHESGLYVVCDGMGGHAAGEVASETAACAIDEYVRANIDSVRAYDGSDDSLAAACDVLRRAIEHANDRVREVAASAKGRPGMGTTCVSVLVLDGKGVMGHVGDSRLYMQRGGNVFQLSEDHTYVNDAVRHGLLTREQARTSPYAHAVTRGIGMGETVCVDTLIFDLLPGDSLLLCSDGLYEYFDDPPELAGLLAAEDVETLPSQLVKLANERGGKDNITALVIKSRIDEDTDRHEIQRGTQITRNLETLRFIQLFRELTPKELVVVMNAFREAQVDAGRDVIEEGDKSENLYLIVEGECDVMRRGELITTLRAGSQFGEMALLNRRPRTATVRARTDVRLLALSRHDFNQVIRKDNAIAAKLLWKLAQSLSLRLDDLYLLRDSDADQSRRTQKLKMLSPFSD